MTKEELANNKSEVPRNFNITSLKNIPIACYAINSEGELRSWNNSTEHELLEDSRLTEILPEVIDFFRKSNFSDIDFEQNNYGSLVIIHPALHSIVDEIAYQRLQKEKFSVDQNKDNSKTDLDLASKEIWKELLSSFEASKLSHHQNIFDQLNDMIWKIDKLGKFTFINNVGCEYLGMIRNNLIGKSLYDYLDTQSAILIAEKINSLINLKPSQIYFITEVLKFNDCKDEFETKCSPVFDEKGELKEIIGISRELKGRKQNIQYYINKITKLCESIEQKDLILDVVSHDLKNSVNVISGISQVLLEKEKDNEIYNLLYDCSRNLLQQLDEASKYAQIENGEKLTKEALHLKTLINGIIVKYSEVLEKNDIALLYNFNDKFSIYANPIITSVIDNYLSNALKHNPGNKTIVFKAECDDNFCTIKVCDFGTTIIEKNRKVIFERGIRISDDERPGSGLGLSIAKKIVEAHRGEVWVEPNFPSGNRFCFKLPNK